MTTLGTLAEEVRDRLDESTAKFWGDAQIRKWINEAVRDIARRAEVFEVSADLNGVQGQKEYTLAQDVIRVHRVEYVADKNDANSRIYAMEYRDFNSMDAVWWTQQSSTGLHPCYFTLWGYPPNLKMIVYPQPYDSNGKFVVHYFKVPADLATDGSEDGSTVTLPTGWDALVIFYAEYVALRKDADQRWVEAKQLYEEQLGEMIDRTRRWSDQADAIQWNGSLLPSWLYAGDLY